MRSDMAYTAGRQSARNYRLSHKALRRSLICAGTAMSFMLLWALNATYKAVSADRLAAEAAHTSSVRLVRLAMELQAELDAQEDHDRWTLQLYLRLERETMPALQHNLEKALHSCPEAARDHARKALGEFGEDAHRHSHAMLQALQRQGARNRKRSQELASSVLAQARADRERLRASGRGADSGWSDADLEGPLVALARALRRPNATFELALDRMREWENAAAEGLREGGAAGGELLDRMHHLVAAAPLPQNDKQRNEMLAGSSDSVATFILLLQRARLHRHLPGLLEALETWERRTSTVWDAIEYIERLRVSAAIPLPQPHPPFSYLSLSLVFSCCLVTAWPRRPSMSFPCRS
jgi:hypothetical protein